MRWERVQQQGAGEVGATSRISGPGKRWGHTCSAVNGGEFLYVFGGYGRDNCPTNQVHVFDNVKQTWNEPVLKGLPPSARDSHSCTTVRDNLFVFGGTDGMKPLNDLHVLDTSTHTWVFPSVRGDEPDAREGHSATLVGKRLFIFGGCGKSSNSSTEVYYNDLYILDTVTFIWKRANTSGTPPSARDTHSCSSWKNKIIVIGGEDAHDFYLSDVHILDTDNLVWEELNTSGQLLPPRAGHATVSFGKNLFVFGGFTDAQNLYDDLHMLDVETGLWTKLTAIGDGPSARFSVAGDSLDPCKGGVLVFVGGCSRQLEALDDMYYLHTELMSENCRDEQRMEKLSLRKQLKLKCQSKYLCPSAHDKALPTSGTDVESCQPIRVPIYGQPSTQNFPFHESPLHGKRSFQAKVTQSFQHGYAIETVIDGKPLRGILFSNRSSSFHVSTHSNRKRSASEVSGVKLHGNHNGEQNKIEKGETDRADEPGRDPTESAAVSVKVALENPGPSDARVMSSDDEKMDDFPNSSSKGSEQNACSSVKDDGAALSMSLGAEWSPSLIPSISF